MPGHQDTAHCCPHVDLGDSIASEAQKNEKAHRFSSDHPPPLPVDDVHCFPVMLQNSLKIKAVLRRCNPTILHPVATCGKNTIDPSWICHHRSVHLLQGIFATSRIRARRLQATPAPSQFMEIVIRKPFRHIRPNPRSIIEVVVPKLITQNRN